MDDAVEGVLPTLEKWTVNGWLDTIFGADRNVANDAHDPVFGIRIAGGVRLYTSVSADLEYLIDRVETFKELALRGLADKHASHPWMLVVVTDAIERREPTSFD